MNVAEKFRHFRSAYERPSLPYRCGRAATWGHPCWQGPDLKGRCGGTAECVPARKGDRWGCRRPTRAGGNCEAGPLPDGSCCLTRPPCLPQPTLRKRRGRLSLWLIGLIAALLVAFSNPNSTLFSSVEALDAGPLSDAHAGFIGTDRCEACHDAHLASGIEWWAKVFENHDNDAQCLQCHTFAGPNQLAHNRLFPGSDESRQPDCAVCHKEHRGPLHDLTKVSDQTCNNCHKVKFESFTEGHPEFAPNFPYQTPHAVYFDHSTHVGKHFASTAEKNTDTDPALARFARQAKRDCTACHEVTTATREVTPRPFSDTCGNCHAQQIAARPLVLLANDSLIAASAFVLGVSEDADDADEQALEMHAALAESGVDSLTEMLEPWESNRVSELLDGLSPEMLQAAAAAWAEEEDYEVPESELRMTGWRAGEDDDGNQTLRYLPRGHQDPLIRAWLEELARLAKDAEDEDRRELAAETLSQFLDASEGPGACGKCHSAGITATNESGQSAPWWGLQASRARRHTHYAHAPHLDLLGRGDACQNCHVLNPEADYASYFESDERQNFQFVANFSPIGKSTCESCHKPGKVRFDCQLCHTYHQDPTFNIGFQIKRVARNE